MTLKTKTVLITLLSLAVSIATPLPTVQAAGGEPSWPAISLTANKTSAATNDAVTVTARFFLYECNAINQGTGKPVTKGRPEDCNENFGGASGQTVEYPYSCPLPDEITATIVATGDAVTLSKATICGSGTDTFTVKSSVTGGKTVKIALTSKFDGEALRSSTNTLSLNFTAPVVAKPKVVTPAPAPAPVVEKPAAPTIATIMADSKEVQTGEEVLVTTGQPLTLTGKTIANGKVALWVFSEPKLYETTADKDGNWSVTVKDLPEGNHHAEIEVTNPTTNLKSDRTKLLDFKVVADKKPVTQAAPTTNKPKSQIGLWIGLIGGTLAMGLIGAYFWWRKKHQQSPPTTPNSGDSVTPPLNDPRSGGNPV